MSEPHDEERPLLDRYAHATSPTPSQVEHALTRTLARIESSRRTPSLPDPRRRLVWFAAAGLATLAIATGAFAGARWLRAQTQPSEPSYGAARFDHLDTGVDERATTSTPGLERAAPACEPTQPVEPVEPELEQPEPEAPAPKPRPRARAEDPREQPAEPTQASEPSMADASVLAEESRLLARVRRALHDDDFEGALEWAEEHARRHPLGVLTEERLVLEAVAACRGGQRERGLAAAKQLREQFPGTPTLAKIEQACGEP